MRTLIVCVCVSLVCGVVHAGEYMVMTKGLERDVVRKLLQYDISNEADLRVLRDVDIKRVLASQGYLLKVRLGNDPEAAQLFLVLHEKGVIRTAMAHEMQISVEQCAIEAGIIRLDNRSKKR